MPRRLPASFPGYVHPNLLCLIKPDAPARILDLGDLTLTHKLCLVLGSILLALGPAAAKAQKNEVGLVIGATVTREQSLAGSPTTLSYQSSLALGAEFDRRLITGRRAALYAGADFLASPLDVKLKNPPASVSGQYAYVFLTPHARLKFNPDGALSPWLLFGGGYSRFLEKKPATAPSFVPGTNTGTFVFGAGIDTSALLHVWRIPIGFRGEVRDFYSGLPNYNQPVSASRQHNVAITGGLLIRF